MIASASLAQSVLRAASEEQSLGEQLWHHLGATPGGLLGAVIAAVCIYAVFLVFVRIAGPRSLQGMHTFDTVIILMFGGVCARVTLGNEPTLLTGIVALATLFILEAVFGKVRDTVRGSKLLNSPPTAVIADGKLNRAVMQRLNITDAELASVLRRAGVQQMDQVSYLILEPNGQFSVIRAGQTIDAELLRGVKHARA